MNKERLRNDQFFLMCVHLWGQHGWKTKLAEILEVRPETVGRWARGNRPKIVDLWLRQVYNEYHKK